MSDKKHTMTTYVNIDRETNRKLKEIAQKKGNLTKNTIIKIAIAEYLERNYE